MAKLSKTASVLEDLRKMALNQQTKEASDVTTSKAVGADTHPASVPAKTETVDKNKQKPEDLKQDYSQKPAHGVNHIGASKTAIEQLGEAVLNEVNKLNKGAEEEAQKSITGVPGKDTHDESVPVSPEIIDKNKVEPEKLKQLPMQEPAAKGESLVTAKSAAEQEAVKVASFELGRQVAVGLLSSLAQATEKQATVKTAEQDKEASKREFEGLVNAAAEKLAQEKVKQAEAGFAEELGKLACDLTVRDAQNAALREENTKYATWFENVRAEILQKEAQQAELQKQADLKVLIEGSIKTAMENLLKQSVPAAK